MPFFLETLLPGKDFEENFNNTTRCKKTCVLFSLKEDSSSLLKIWGYAYNNPQKEHAEDLIWSNIERYIPENEIKETFTLTFFTSHTPCLECSEMIKYFLESRNGLRMNIKASKPYFFEKEDMRRGLCLLKSMGVSIKMMDQSDYEQCFGEFVDPSEKFTPWVGLNEKSKKNADELDNIWKQVFFFHYMQDQHLFFWEYQSRQLNMMIRNMPERNPDQLRQRFLSWVNSLNMDINYAPEDLTEIYRLGHARNRASPRVVIVKFANLYQKNYLKSHLRKAGTQVQMMEGNRLELYNDLPWKEINWRKMIKPVTRYLRGKNINYKWHLPKQMKIYFNGNVIKISSQLDPLDVMEHSGIVEIDSLEWKSLKEELIISGGTNRQKEEENPDKAEEQGAVGRLPVHISSDEEDEGSLAD